MVYGLVAVLGFISGGEDILGLMANNMADNLLYLGVTASSLCYGFVDKDRAVETPVVTE